jgi:hypothetical protein
MSRCSCPSSLGGQAGFNNDIGIRCGSSGDEPHQRNSTTQVEAGNSSSVYGLFEAVGSCVRVRSGQAAQHSAAGFTESFTSNQLFESTAARQPSFRLLQAAQKRDEVITHAE